MRLAELAFLVLLVGYHAFLLVPRYRRPFPANYLVFLAGMALAWNLGLEGLRWQTLPPTLLLLIDLAVLFPSFATLRGRLPGPGFWRRLGRGCRTLTASAAFLLAGACALLAVAFPLPRVELTGGLTPSYRVVHFPSAGERPGMELRLWYPASGDLHPLPRAISSPENWRQARINGGLPVFWQSYLGLLPTSLIRGGKLASLGTKYPVVYVALPRGQDAGDFGYLFEDLASRGFVVAAGVPLPAAPAAEAPFSWTATFNELSEPFRNPRLWLEPEATQGQSEGPADYRWVGPAHEALKQLDTQPGDLLFGGVDWDRQGLWVWGYGTPLAAEQSQSLGLRGALHAGGRPPAGHRPASPELWVVGGKSPEKAADGQWFLALPSLHRADLSDSAYLRPALALIGLKAQPDAGLHGALRQYQAAFFQFVFWGSGDASFGQTVPEVPGLTLTGR
jgi:hypothetical protein